MTNKNLERFKQDEARFFDQLADVQKEKDGLITPEFDWWRAQNTCLNAGKGASYRYEDDQLP